MSWAHQLTPLAFVLFWVDRVGPWILRGRAGIETKIPVVHFIRACWVRRYGAAVFQLPLSANESGCFPKF